jgi:hypothetical protein
MTTISCLDEFFFWVKIISTRPHRRREDCGSTYYSSHGNHEQVNLHGLGFPMSHHFLDFGIKI